VYSDARGTLSKHLQTPTHGPDADTWDIEVEELPETDKDRRQAMMTSMDPQADNLRIGTLADLWSDFIFTETLNVEELALSTGAQVTTTVHPVSSRKSPPPLPQPPVGVVPA